MRIPLAKQQLMLGLSITFTLKKHGAPNFEDPARLVSDGWCELQENKKKQLLQITVKIFFHNGRSKSNQRPIERFNLYSTSFVTLTKQNCLKSNTKHHTRSFCSCSYCMTLRGVVMSFNCVAIKRLKLVQQKYTVKCC